jgi:cell division initiation protein
MRITPLDLRNHGFARRWTGYAREEVDEFLTLVAEDYEGVLRELSQQAEQLVRLGAQVEHLSASEQVLQDTLMLAQKVSTDLKQTAVKEAEVLVAEAEVRGEKILEAAHRRAAALAEDIREMKQLKARLAASLRGAFETHLRLLDGLATEPPGDPLLEGKVAYLRRTQKEAATGEG